MFLDSSVLAAEITLLFQVIFLAAPITAKIGYCNLTTRATAGSLPKTSSVKYVQLSVSANQELSPYIYGINNIQGTIIDQKFAKGRVLGQFGKLGVYMGAYWDIPWGPAIPFQKSATSSAFRMYRNFDCSGAHFGDYSVEASSNDTNTVSVFASVSSKQGKDLTLVVLNKNTTDVVATITVKTGRRKKNCAKGKVYRYTESNLTEIVREADVELKDGKATLYLPAYSITTIKFD